MLEIFFREDKKISGWGGGGGTEHNNNNNYGSNLFEKNQSLIVLYFKLFKSNIC